MGGLSDYLPWQDEEIAFQAASMDSEWKELMRVTNILCGLVFGFCKRKATRESREIAAAAVQKICDVIRLMENNRK